MPNLHPRPSAGLPHGQLVPPSAGPVSEQLAKVSGKLVDHLRGTLEDLFKELVAHVSSNRAFFIQACRFCNVLSCYYYFFQGSPEAQLKSLQLEMEKLQWRHQQELAEVKHNGDLILMELRKSMEAERQKALSDFKKQAEIEKQKAISETKKKQWCANCGVEAELYCCWNTTYCGYPCQVSGDMCLLAVSCPISHSWYMAKIIIPIFTFFCSKPTGLPTWPPVPKTNPTRMTRPEVPEVEEEEVPPRPWLRRQLQTQQLPQLR